MDQPIIIWPPNSGNFDDGQGTAICEDYYGMYDCTDAYDAYYGYEAGSGMVCCPG